MSSMKDWALYYASQGIHVFPLVPHTKSPFKDSHGSKDATTDVAQINAWWDAYPEANIGTTPSASGRYVYDVDPRNGGDVTHERLQAEHGVIDSPLRVNTPGGGIHLYYAARAGFRYNCAPGAGIDGKYNAFVVLPPSRHPNGGIYTWAGAVPGQVEAPTIPAFLVKPIVARSTNRIITGGMQDVEKIQKALERIDPEHYDTWTATMASLKHWEDTASDECEGIGFELGRAWSAQCWKHDDGKFEDKWQTWESDKAGARTLGSLLHDAGMTAAQETEALGAAFAQALRNAPPAIPGVASAPEWWTTEPVPRFRGTLDPMEVLTELNASDGMDYAANKAAGNVLKMVDAVVWSVAGSCEHALQILMTDGMVDTPDLRGLIAANAQRRTTWKTVNTLNAEQQALAAQGVMAEVEVDDGKLDAALRQVIATLPAIPGVLQRANRLCWVTADGRIMTYDVHTLSALLERYLRMVKGKGAPTKCPEALAKRVMGVAEYPGVPVVKAVVNLPVARSDGSIISKVGIDESTGILLQGNGYRAPRVLNDAERAETLKRVWSLFDGFPFASAEDRSAYFAALLTTAIRSTIETAPVFMITAGTAGTGKTKLAECLMVAADASKAAAVLPDERREQNVTIMSMLMEAPRGILFDNLIGALKPTGPLCMASTSSEYMGRLLGLGVMARLENRAVWALTGNNVWVVGDMTRRVLNITLDSPEDPEKRRFPFDPVQMLERSLTDFRLSLLDLIHTWAESGKPHQDTVGGFASFEQWSQIVRPVCIWLGMGDPLDVMRATQEEDPERSKLILTMEAWEARFGDREVQLRQLNEVVFVGDFLELWKEAEEAVCSFKGQTDRKKWGYYLRGKQKIKINGRQFIATGPANRRLWKLVKL